MAARYAPIPLQYWLANLTFSAKNLDGSPITDELNFSPTGKVTIAPANNDGDVSLTLDSASGVFNGTVLLPVSRKKASFNGVIYLKPAPAGFGLFMDAGTCGSVEIGQ
jgi:hypothetical protein